MLQLITGRSGSGKTTEIYRQLKQRAAEEAALFLLVPEQASYENERLLLTELGPVLSQRVQVLSFTRMVNTVFREVGGLSGHRIDGTLSLLLISQALHSVADSLTLYRRHVDTPEYLQALAGMLTECKQCAITPELLEETAASLPDGLLRRKLTELSLIFGAYDALVTGAAFVDPQDDLTWLAKTLPRTHTFDGAYVYVDGFKGFTRQEQIVLERLLTRVAGLTVALCTDKVTPQKEQVFDRFSTASRTAVQLRDAAAKAHIRTVTVKQLTENHRTDDAALLALEAGCFTAGTPIFEESTTAVTVTPCDDRIDECRYAARLIRRLLREEGGYCRDFTIVTRDPNGYNDLLEAALRREGLPCCRDHREPVLTQPLITLVESALAAVTGGWDSGDVLRMVKTGLAGFSTTSASLLENYVFTWNIRGRQWTAPFTEHPDGLTAEADEHSERQLAYLNILRQRLAKPLASLSARLSGLSTGRQFADAIYTLLKDLRVARSVRLRVAKLDTDREHALADYQSRLWDYLMGLLDKFAVGLSDTRLPAARFAELFHLAVANDDLGTLPQGLDGVVVGSVDRIRYAQPKTVIVLGANEGILPAYPSTGGILTDYERQQLITAGLPMADSTDHQTAEERFYAYAAIAAPSERLIVTYRMRNGKDPAYASSLVSEIERLVPQHIKASPTDIGCESEEDAFSTLASRYRENSADAAAYRAVFSELPTYTGRLEAMRRLDKGFAFQSKQAAHDFFGDSMRLSPSQAEAFYQCRFAYFCNYGLNLKSRQIAEINPADAGTLTHNLMQSVLPGYCERGIQTVTREEIAADSSRFVTTYVETCMGGKESRNARFYALIKRLTMQCDLYLWRVVTELQQGRFMPADHELPIGRLDDNGNGVPAWDITLPNRSTMHIVGKIDRVDTYHRDGKTYLRVMDYKTGSKSFDIANVLAGLDVQLLMYLFALCATGRERYGDIVPSGIFYVPSNIPQLDIDSSSPAEQIEEQQLRSMQMTGLMLDDPDILRAMEADLGGIFIPTGVDAKGNQITEFLVSLEQFGILQRHIESLLSDMVALLHEGDIAALPKMRKYLPCDRCVYHDICGREAADPVTEISKCSVQEALADMEADNDE